MPRYNQMDPQRRQEIVHTIDRRWGQLYELEKESGERAIRYLLLTNSGGAVATLSFIGASDFALTSLWVLTALFHFVLGIVLVGVSCAIQYHSKFSLFKAYRQDVETFYDCKQGWREVCENDNNRAIERFRDFAVPYASFACFVVGCVLGSIGLFSS